MCLYTYNSCLYACIHVHKCTLIHTNVTYIKKKIYNWIILLRKKKRNWKESSLWNKSTILEPILGYGLSYRGKSGGNGDWEDG